MGLFQKRKPFTIASLDSCGLTNICSLNKDNSAYLIKVVKPEGKITFTIPIDIYEIYIDINDGEISGWDEFYMTDKDRLYKEKIKELSAFVKGECSLQIKEGRIYLKSKNEEKIWF